jgi:hypothetical protein
MTSAAQGLHPFCLIAVSPSASAGSITTVLLKVFCDGNFIRETIEGIQHDVLNNTSAESVKCRAH